MRKILLLLFIGIQAFAQKAPLNHSVYDGWKNISNSGITQKGDKFYFVISPQEGDNQLILKTAQNQTIFSLARVSNPRFTSDERFFVTTVNPLYKDLRQAKIDKKKRDEMPKDSLAIYNFEKKTWIKIPNVKSYFLPEENSQFLSYLYDEVPEKKKPTTKKDTAAKKETPAARSKKPTTNLIVYKLGSGVDTTFINVDSYQMDKWGQYVVFSKKADEKDSLGNTAGVFKYHIASKTLIPLLTGKGDYKELTFDDAGKQFAFLADKSPEKSLLKDFKVYYHQENQGSLAKNIATSGIPEKWYVSGDGRLQFSKNGDKLFLGIAPIPRVKDTTLVDFENAKLDIWHWQDDYLQTQQLVNLRRDLAKNYLSVVHTSAPEWVVPLADENLPDTRGTFHMDNEYILATTDVGRRIETQWQTGSFQDLYLVSTKDGSRKKVKENLRGNASLSNDGKYVLWYDRENGSWNSYNIATGKAVHLNKDLKVSFADEENDSPDTPGSYGSAGWADGKVYLYDRYDIWSFNLDGSGSTKLTNGRDKKVTYRYQEWKEKKNRMEPTIIDESQNLILTAFDNVSKKNGFQALKKGDALWAENAYSQIKESQIGNTYIYTKENYQNSPDLYVSKDFKAETKVSDINPQQKYYNWGTAEHFKWTTPSGKPAEGILYKPEDFDPSKTYPVIAYFYELLSDGLYRYQAPAPTPSRLNISFFVSNGYVVLAPDIRYDIGYPGKSAEEYINSGMAELKKNSWAGKLGIQGQSWGGYQVAHLITATNMYDAAWSGAPVVNMTSAYGGIRWQTGMNRQFQYERTQSRIGATLWEKPELYIENSPLFHFPKVTTPVVIMHNDEDGAVPWYQGIEMFTALRRLQKPVWMLNYNGDAHNLVQRQNRKDIQRRQLQFFDHYLKGKRAAPWIEKGVPATLKGIDWGFGD